MATTSEELHALDDRNVVLKQRSPSEIVASVAAAFLNPIEALRYD